MITTATAPELSIIAPMSMKSKSFSSRPSIETIGLGKLHLLAQMNAEQAADVAVAGQHHRMAVASAPESSPSTTPLQKASSRWKVAEPRQGTKTATGRLALGEIELLQRGS